MLLIGITEEPGWIRSTFNLTYRVSWETLLKGVRGVYPYMRDVSQKADDPEILVDDEIIQISSPDEILAIPEAGSITIRGFVPEEYQNTDYEKFNKSLCQFMDSIEIMMHIPPAE